MTNVYYLYILECSNGAYYTGYTVDIERRYMEHLQGNAKSKYTRSFPPVRLANCWTISSDLSDILKLEIKIKQLSKQQKKNLISDPSQLACLAAELALGEITIHPYQG